ncbi:MAG: AAA family ATPase [Candidatus Cryptobacteroides sp.]
MLYPIGIQNFEKIRTGGYTYVDKTALIYKLVSSGTYYFLSRPRRFGKSLLISTMQAFFEGKKELFNGLAIDGLEKDWNEYPVLRIDFSGENFSNPDSLGKILETTLSAWEHEFKVSCNAGTFALRFKAVIEAAYTYTGHQVVILIDEYDKPIVDNIGDDSLVWAFRKELQGFYSVLKAKDEFIRFGFLTGVTKIGKVSVFSGLNNLNDISMDARYFDICGVSQKELKSYFDTSVEELAAANGIDKDACYQKLARMYDGYHFHQRVPGMYNPFSLLNTFQKREFREYWFETGTPSFLAEVMKNTDYDVTMLSHEQADSTLLTDIDTVFLNPIPLLYQSGYLTITGYDDLSGIYNLGFPNLEVKHGFLSYLLNYYTTVRKGTGNLLIRQMSIDLRMGHPSDFMKRMEAFFARQNYQIQADVEKDFQYAMSIILQLLGEYFTVRTEDASSSGRTDISIETSDFIYIIEIKRDDTADSALEQIEEKAYGRRYADDPRKLFKIGVSFSTTSRGIEDWKVS